MQKANEALSPEEFVRIWQGCDSYQEFMKKTGLNYSAASARVSTYRKRGVKLKKIGRARRSQIDVERLNQIISEMNGQHK